MRLRNKVLLGGAGALGTGLVIKKKKQEKRDREMAAAIAEVLSEDLTDIERMDISKVIVKGAESKGGNDLDLTNEQIVELFKRAFGEEAYEELVKKAADEVIAELMKEKEQTK